MMRKIGLNKSEILRGSALALVVKVFSAFVVFLMNVLISRTLGLDDAGLFFLGFSILFLLSGFSRAGLDLAFVKYIALFNKERKFSKLKSIYRFGLCVTIVLSIFIAISGYINSSNIAVYIFSKQKFSEVFSIMILALPFLTLYTMHAYVMQAFKRTGWSVLFLNGALPFCIVALIYTGLASSLASISQGLLYSSVVIAVLSVVVMRLPRATNDDKEVIVKKQIMSTSLPMFVSVIMIQGLLWIGQIFVGIWGEAGEVAIFNSAQRTAGLISFTLVAINSIAAPKFAELHAEKNPDNIAHIVLYASRLSIVMGFLSFVIIVFLGEFLLSLFGEDYVAAYPLLVLLSVGQLISVASGPGDYFLIMTGREKSLRNYLLSAFFVACVSGFILVPLYGMYGAAFTMIISTLTHRVLVVKKIYSAYGINLFSIKNKRINLFK